MFRESQKIGSYTLISKIGKGGFGEVWLAEKRSQFVTKKVALKLPLDEQVDHEAIKQEATLWEQASGHPNILPIIDADEYDGQIVIVSEYAPDGSLEEWLKNHGKMPVEKAVEMTIKILDGLEFLHSRKIIHRDLKPANILLQGETPRLADFGISCALLTTVASQSQNISGTFAYMSPEALDGRRSVQTDIWSVGVNLYQFLTGNLPFPQKEPFALIAAIMMRGFEPLPANIPQSLQSIITRALAKQPERRYSSAGDMREDLRRVARGERLPDFSRSFQPEIETVVRSKQKFGQNKRHKISNIGIYAAIAFILISAISFVAYFLSNQSKQTELSKNEAAKVLPIQQTDNSVNSNGLIDINSNPITPTPVERNSNTPEIPVNKQSSQIKEDNTAWNNSPPTYTEENYKVYEPRSEQPSYEDGVILIPVPVNKPEQQVTPEPKPTPAPVPKTISGGVLNGKATSLPAPPYPAAAKAVGAKGSVSVQVLIDENGNVVSASAVNGHPLLRSAAAGAARRAKFAPFELSGQPVKVSGVITYVFN